MHKTRFFTRYVLIPLGGIAVLYSALNPSDPQSDPEPIGNQPPVEAKPGIQKNIDEIKPQLQECQEGEYIVFASEDNDTKKLFFQGSPFTIIQDFDYLEASRVKACVRDLEILVKEGKVEFYVNYGGSNEKEREFSRYWHVRDDDKDPNPKLQGYWAHHITHAEVPVRKGLTGSKVRIGILDTGIHPTVPQFRKKIKVFHDFVYQQKEAYDDGDHGTFVAGIINKVVPDAGLCVYKIHDREGLNYISDVLEGLNQTIVDHLDVINNSWGLTEPRELEGMTWEDGNRVLAEALERVAKKGVIIESSAGNNSFYGSFHDYAGSFAVMQLPEGSPYTISTGATDVRGEIADFSDLDAHLFAPGDLVYSTKNAKEYRLWSGTSFSGPFVTAAIAVVQDYGKKKAYLFSREEILKILQQSATDQSSILVLPNGEEVKYHFKALDYRNLTIYLEQNYPPSY